LRSPRHISISNESEGWSFVHPNADLVKLAGAKYASVDRLCLTVRVSGKKDKFDIPRCTVIKKRISRTARVSVKDNIGHAQIAVLFAVIENVE
jgi:hypothetical protein